MLVILYGIISGIGIPIQAGINQKLGQRLQSSFLPPLVSFLVSAVITSVILIITGEGFAFEFTYEALFPLWKWLGGTMGYFLLLTSVVVIPAIGGVQLVILSMVGQIIAGIIIDNFGLFRTTVIPASFLRMLGAMLVISGALVVSIEKLDYRSLKDENRKKVSLYRLMALASGIAVALQVTFNGYLSSDLGSPLQASLVSFSTGFFVSGMASLMLLKAGRLYSEYGGRPGNKWWMWIGGSFGVLSVSAYMLMSRALGISTAVVVSLVGQIIGGILVDHIGFLGIPVRKLTWRKVSGLAIMITGTVMIRLM